MKANTSGKLAIKLDKSTAVVVWGHEPQDYLVHGDQKIIVAPALSSKNVTLKGRTLRFTGPVGIVIEENQNFGWLEVLPLDEKRAKAFLIAVQGNSEILEKTADLLRDIFDEASQVVTEFKNTHLPEILARIASSQKKNKKSKEE